MKRLILTVFVAVVLTSAAAAAAGADDGTPVRTHVPKVAPPASLLPPAAKKMRPGRASRSLQASYQFYVDDPNGRCQILFLGISNTKVVGIDPPKVYSGENVAQWVYWQPFVWNVATEQDLWFGTVERSVAYPNSPAVFSGGRQVQSFDISDGTLAAGIYVWWYSFVDGWHSAVAWAVPLLTGGYVSAYSNTPLITTQATC